MEELRDKILICKDCGRKFTFTVDEQKLFGQKGWSDPIRCVDCRQRKKLIRKFLEDGVPISDEGVHETRCADCGRKILSTREVKEGEKEYCRECWIKIKGV